MTATRFPYRWNLTRFPANSYQFRYICFTILKPTYMEQVSTYASRFTQWLVTYGPGILGAIVVLIIGLYLTNWIGRLVTRALSKRNVDVSLQSFLGSLV